MFTVKEVAQLFGIEVEDSRIVTSVEFDSRKVVAGSLFVPLAGARDGLPLLTKRLLLERLQRFGVCKTNQKTSQSFR